MQFFLSFVIYWLACIHIQGWYFKLADSVQESEQFAAKCGLTLSGSGSRNSNTSPPGNGNCSTSSNSTCNGCSDTYDNLPCGNGTPNGTPNRTPNGTPNGIPHGTPHVTPNGTPNRTPDATPNRTPFTVNNATINSPAKDLRHATINSPPVNNHPMNDILDTLFKGSNTTHLSSSSPIPPTKRTFSTALPSKPVLHPQIFDLTDDDDDLALPAPIYGGLDEEDEQLRKAKELSTREYLTHFVLL